MKSNKYRSTKKENKRMEEEGYERHPNDLQQFYINFEVSKKWLQTDSLFTETEGSIIAIQGQIINTKNFRKYVIKDLTVTNHK